MSSIVKDLVEAAGVEPVQRIEDKQRECWLGKLVRKKARYAR
jgi:hypothetical protein